MLGGYQILDLTMIDLNGGDIPASAKGKELFEIIANINYTKKPTVLKVRMSSDIFIVSRFEVYNSSRGYDVIFGEKIYNNGYTADYDTAYGLLINSDGAINIINF